MKRLILFPIVLLLILCFTLKNGLTDEERTNAVAHLTESREHMMQVLDGLTEEQLNFKATAESWSIAECVEHITIAEHAFENFVKKTVAEGNIPHLKDSVQWKDNDLFAQITNRSQKVKTAEPFEPSGKFGSHEATVKAFNKKRDEHINYVKTTNDDLRNRFNTDLPFGVVDGYQLLLFAAGHCERHVLQMEEIMAHNDFPSEDMGGKE
ncbi:DinB family protein [Allomuricauda sp. d1]|uniref:DinB family protein n=1 Tax=Allomuricauda sp. d1 TaxID=3136725 RepID=UPI0031DE08E7